jgi:hypothetical protein
MTGTYVKDVIRPSEELDVFTAEESLVITLPKQYEHFLLQIRSNVGNVVRF